MCVGVDRKESVLLPYNASCQTNVLSLLSLPSSLQQRASDVLIEMRGREEGDQRVANESRERLGRKSRAKILLTVY